jgi:hypothetical protein
MLQGIGRPALKLAGGVSIQAVQTHAAQKGRDRAARCA